MHALDTLPTISDRRSKYARGYDAEYRERGGPFFERASNPNVEQRGID